MNLPQWKITSIGGFNYAIHDRNRTVAVITSDGDVYWLLKSPMDDGPCIESPIMHQLYQGMRCLRFHTICPVPNMDRTYFDFYVQESDATLVLTIQGFDNATGNFGWQTTAWLTTDIEVTRYEWHFENVLTCTAYMPVERVTYEYNRLCTGYLSAGLTFIPDREYDIATLMDVDGTVWAFDINDQDANEYAIKHMKFAHGSFAGFFRPNAPNNPIIVVDKSDMTPAWQIGDHHTGLRCQAKSYKPMENGQQRKFYYQLRYLGREDGGMVLDESRPVETLGV